MKKRVAFIIAVAIIILLALPNITFASTTEEKTLRGKNLAILGDSISTYSNYSNGSAAQNTNSTIKNAAVYYPRSSFDVTADSTWWMQAASTLGMNLLVNNSWSGSCLLKTRSGTVGAYLDRCVQLHDDTGENAGEAPDIIAIFLGTNDYYTYPDTLGSFEDINFESLINESNDSVTYNSPVTSMEAYAIVLHKIKKAYPNAEIYCFTLLQRLNSSNQPTAFNADIIKLAEKYDANIVDLYNCGITSESYCFNTFMGDSLHPNNAGMDAISNAFISSLIKNSSYTAEKTHYDVSFELNNVIATEGTTRTVMAGEPFSAKLKGKISSQYLNVKVYMGDADITSSCYDNGLISISSVTDNVTVKASLEDRAPASFYWQINNEKNSLISVSDSFYKQNKPTLISGNITDGKFSGVRITLEEAIVLKHDQQWFIEWKSQGSWSDTTDGALLFAGASNSTTPDTPYLYRRHNSDFIAFGVASGGRYYNYGVSLKENGIDGTIEHIYRLENRIADDGSNMVYLLVDGEEIAPMNHHWIGGTDQKKTVDWLNGRDLTFTHMGTSPHTIGNCYIDYIQVSEDGTESKKDSHTDNFYWQINNEKNSLISVFDSFYKQNKPTLTSGNITDGKFSGVRITLEEAIVLKHDQQWFIEWKSQGSWSDTTDGALLFAGASNSTTPDTPYLYRRHNSDFIAFGVASGGRYYNYGVSLKENGIDGTIEHIYRLENRIADDGSNMVYLLVDGEEIAPMNHHWIGGTDQKKTVDWLNGRDLTFTHMGTSPHTIGNCYIDYIQVSEDGHKHIYENGTCTLCGHTVKIPDEEKTIEFYIDDRIFTAIDGQSWSEWIFSYEISAGDNGIVWIGYDNHPTMEQGYLYYSDEKILLGAAQIMLNDKPMRYDDKILNVVYTLKDTKMPQ